VGAQGLRQVPQDRLLRPRGHVRTARVDDQLRDIIARQPQRFRVPPPLHRARHGSRSARTACDNDISRQIRAITGPGGASAAGQTSQKVAQAGITRTSLGAIPNTRALAAQIAACQPSGNASGLSLPPAASQAAAAQAERIRLPEGVYHERPQALNQALAGDDKAPAQSITRDRKPEFLPGQGAQPGSKLTAARAAHAAGTGDPTANAVKSSRARAAASAKAARK
jgi:hypothetical protein